MSAPAGGRYQPDAPLPQGGLAIEASAGTGKTYALADLATRFVAETDLSVSDLLIVTFTRAATDELRARVRGRLIEVADHLRRGEEGPPDDLVLRHLLARGDPRMLERLTTAITEFDSATITTIHGFATQIRGALGLAVGVDPDARVVEEDLDLINDACVDVLAAAAGIHPADDLPKLKNLRDATRRVAGRPDIVLAPTADDAGVSPASVLMGTLVRRSVDQLVDRRRRSGTRNFDDVLIELAEGLAGPRSSAAVLGLRSRFKVALIDEFQDTDPVQWRIFRTLFASDTATAMVLVGDPKQAIYGFRGGDIETYLAAVGDGSRMARRSLAVNWRSDGAALTALDRLLDGVTFGDQRIRFAPVEPAEQNRHRRMHTVGDEPLPALAVRLAVGEGINRTSTRGGAEVRVDSADKAIAADLVAQVRALLDGARIPSGDDAGRMVPVRPQDIAVLVNRHEQCATIQTALADQGVPAVVARGGSVLLSPAADQVRWLLHAMARPSDPRRARMFALSWFGGWSADRVALASDDDLALIQEQVAGWSERLRDHSVADTLARVWSERSVAATVLSGPDGDRNMTDLDHLAELLHGASPNGRSSVAGLLAVLDAGPDTDEDADPDADGDVTARRIESDAQAVQVMTLWTAKGLEFPIVCVPTLWRWTGTNDPVLFVDPVSGKRTYDLTGGAAWPDQESGEERKRLAVAERTGESLRLLYVALTRAKHQTILWWANGRDSSKTALARVLFPPGGGPTDDGTGLSASVSVPADSLILASLSHLGEGVDNVVTVAAFGGPSGGVGRWEDGTSTGSGPGLAAARFTATPDRSTQRWSFTSIARRSSSLSGDPYDPAQGDSGADDEQIEDQAGDTDPTGADHHIRSADVAAAAGSLSLLPAGASFGTLVHSVLERVDFAAVDLAVQIEAGIDRELAWRPLDLTPRVGDEPSPAQGRRLLTAGLLEAITTPLGPLCPGRALADVGPDDRLNELSFDLRLGAGGRQASLAEIGQILRARLDAADPLLAWAAGLADGKVDFPLAGHLTGSIDLVLRTGGEDGGGRFVVADYKTNALTAQEKVPVPGDYRPERLAEAMAEHDYPLQALLYAVALHRYLRWRLADRYRPEDHLGGVVYLFLRGMTGPGVPVSGAGPHGVFSWALPPDAVAAVSDLLAGRPPAELVA